MHANVAEAVKGAGGDALRNDQQFDEGRLVSELRGWRKFFKYWDKNWHLTEFELDRLLIKSGALLQENSSDDADMVPGLQTGAALQAVGRFPSGGAISIEADLPESAEDEDGDGGGAGLSLADIRSLGVLLLEVNWVYELDRVSFFKAKAEMQTSGEYTQEGSKREAEFDEFSSPVFDEASIDATM